MPWLFVVVGLAVGWSSGSGFGALGGAALGGAFAAIVDHRRRIRELEANLRALQDRPGPRTVPEPQPTGSPRAPVPRPPLAATPPRTGAEPAASEAPGRTTLLDGLLGPARAYFESAGVMVVLGVLVLFFGVAFLLKYAADRGLLSVELRLLGAAAGGVAMMAFGWRTRGTKPTFGRVLQGGGLGVVYLTAFAAYRLYELLPPVPTFLLFVSLVALSAFLAVVQDTRALALIAATGGFLAPVLASTGRGSHVALFSYYLVLNAGILAISWLRSWRSLNIAGFLFTFVLSGTWALRDYRPAHFSSTEPFLAAFFLMYVAIAVAFAIREQRGGIGLVDGTLVFGVPLATAAFQARLVSHFEYGLAWSALVLGLFYLVLSSLVLRLRGEPLRPLGEAFRAEGAVFLTLAVPLAFEGLLTSAFWALEGAALVWVGTRQDRLPTRLFGIGLQAAAGVAFLADGGAHGQVPLANPHFLGAALIAGAALASSFYLARAGDGLRSFERPLGRLAFGYGITWWLAGGLHELFTFLDESAHRIAALLVLLSLTAVAASVLGRGLAWRALERVPLGLLPGLSVAAAATALSAGHPFSGPAALGWIASLAAFYTLLKQNEDRESRLAPYLHAGGFALVTLLFTWEASYRASQVLEIRVDTWSHALAGLVPAGLLLGLFLRGYLLPWPLGKHWHTYTGLAAAPIAAYLVYWMVAIQTTPGDPAPLRYVPLANPVDVAVAAALLALVTWRRTATAWFDDLQELAEIFFPALALLTFVALHGVVARTVHLWLGVPFTSEALFGSVVAQTAVAVLWAATGLASMVLGTRRGHRLVWTVGAALMGAVVAKLFLVDLSHSGTVARIVSFLGVGLLLVAVGYLSPVPPREGEADLVS